MQNDRMMTNFAFCWRNHNFERWGLATVPRGMSQEQGPKCP